MSLTVNNCICNYIYMFRVRFSRDVIKDMKKISPFYRNQILQAVEENLISEPASLSRNRKILINLIPPWEAMPPIWELRVGHYRVFYDVDTDEKVVYVRAVKIKPSGETTKEIL